ncbi:F0F1 ATP synthase subunit delta [Helicobacter suis]|uniref:F0F1 ATP synthase subunit delta n=1 Tax=Helicobacter suis TaxID=104628 RepID=UPI0013D34D27|nr:F0F1 ATP synthase subunit delta [Helicobacter suis]
MIALIAKKYTEALRRSLNPEELEATMGGLETICTLYNHPDFLELIASPYYPESLKQDILTSFLEKKESKLVNLIALLTTHKRLSLLPLIYQELLAQAQRKKNIYQGYLYCNQNIPSEQAEQLKQEVSAYLNISLDLKVFHQDKEGLRLDIPDLEIEIAFYKDYFFKQLKRYIMEAV